MQNTFKNLIYQYKNIIDFDFGVINTNFEIIACSNEALVGQQRSELEDAFYDNENVVFGHSIAYKPVFVRNHLEFILFIEDTSPESVKVLNLLSVAFLNISQIQDEKTNKANYIKQLLQDSILPSDMYIKAKELKIDTEAQRIVFIIKVDKENLEDTYDVLLSMFPEKSKDFLVTVDEETLALVKEVNDMSDKEVYKVACSIRDTVNAELFIKVKVGMGSVISTVREIAISYREAKISIEVSKVFDAEKDIISYENLGIGRLIYQLPTTLCTKFLNEVFKDDTLDTLDDDMVETIQKFFENSHNISETARKLFVHRNTLVYRLDKLQKNTGLDLREFEDAIIFKVAMMVKKYLSANVIKL